MECCGQFIDGDIIWSLRQNKTGFLPSGRCVHTTKWTYHKDTTSHLTNYSRRTRQAGYSWRSKENTYVSELTTHRRAVIYWCTCVNKRKNSGSKWSRDNNITRCPGRFESVGVSWSQFGTRCERENQLAVWVLCRLSDPRLSNPSQDEKEVLLWSKKNLGSI